MTKHNAQVAKVRNFSVAFEQMANFVAIAQTRDYNETIRHLILQCFVVLPDDHFHDAHQVAENIDALFGIQLPEQQIQKGLDKLQSDGAVLRPANSNYVISATTRSLIQKRIDEAITLENKVKQTYLDEIVVKYPNLPPEQLWKSLKGYLSRAFRRHGIQAIALLDPAVDATPEHSESLSFLLDDLLKDVFEFDLRLSARDAIAGFLAKVGQHPDRAAYISQLADGSFNYFSLVVSPNIADQFRSQLNSLTLFLDTNFLFSILDLHVNPFIEVSNELLSVIKKHKFPFNLRYHEATIEETVSTIHHFGDILRSRHWSQAISRAAINSRLISGIELKYHQINAKMNMDVDVFLKPYEHADELLKKKDILIYKKTSARLEARADLIHDYTAFLKARKKDKPYEAIDHDATVLDTVRQLRSSARNSLEAKALLLTCDYLLFKFDWEKSREEGVMANTVLPNTFWQILRPYIPSDIDFDKAFAETFALPEFRTISSGTSKAASKMLSILASYKDLPEETATKMLSNDLLIDQLRTAETDEQFHEYVDSALAEENASLLEEKAALARQIETEKTEREARENMLEEERKRHAQEKAEKDMAIKAKQDEIDSMRAVVAKQSEQAEKERQAKVALETQTEGESTGKKKAERSADIYKTITAVLLSIIFIGIFELTVYLSQWQWLRNHSNSYGLQVGINGMIASFMLGLFRPRWRKVWWLAVLLAFLVLVISLLGGPGNATSSMKAAH